MHHKACTIVEASIGRRMQRSDPIRSRAKEFPLTRRKFTWRSSKSDGLLPLLS